MGLLDRLTGKCQHCEGTGWCNVLPLKRKGYSCEYEKLEQSEEAGSLAHGDDYIDPAFKQVPGGWRFRRQISEDEKGNRCGYGHRDYDILWATSRRECYAAYKTRTGAQAIRADEPIQCNHCGGTGKVKR